MYDYNQLRDICLSKPGAEETFPFGNEVMVPKVGGKMFALITVPPDGLRISLKCDPYKAQDLRDMFEAVTAGYHLNKRHWNTITIDGSVSDDLIREWIDHSYQLVFNSLTKAVKAEIQYE